MAAYRSLLLILFVHRRVKCFVASLKPLGNISSLNFYSCGLSVKRIQIKFKESVIKLPQYFETLLRFSTAESVDDITALCRFHSQLLGFDAYIYALRIPTQFNESRVFVLKGFPDPWLDRYWENGYSASDPVVAYCGQHIIPIQWHKLILDKTSLGEQVMNEAYDFGLKSGISMPVHSPHGELGILSFALNHQSPMAIEVVNHALPYVQMLAGHVHEAVRRVLGLNDLNVRQRLTAREVECLRWAADGKTSWEISHLLNVTERTINFHLNNSMSKLDVCNRQHAIAKAVLQGLVNPQPF